MVCQSKKTKRPLNPKVKIASSIRISKAVHKSESSLVRRFITPNLENGSSVRLSKTFCHQSNPRASPTRLISGLTTCFSFLTEDLKTGFQFRTDDMFLFCFVLFCFCFCFCFSFFGLTMRRTDETSD